MDLREVSDYYVRHSLWPVIFYTSFVAIVGAVGNGFLLYVYWNEYQKSVTIMLIYFLSAVDFCASISILPVELVPLIQMVTFPSGWWCKVSRYLANFFYECTCFTYMVLAFSRYDRLKSLTSLWLNVERGKKSCVAVLIFTSLVNIPSLFFYTRTSVPIIIENNIPKLTTHAHFSHVFAKLPAFTLRPSTLTNTTNNDTRTVALVVGQMCSIESKSYVAISFFGIQFVIYAVLMFLIVFFYTKVAILIRLHREYMENITEVVTRPTSKKNVVNSPETKSKDSSVSTATKPPTSVEFSPVPVEEDNNEAKNHEVKSKYAANFNLSEEVHPAFSVHPTISASSVDPDAIIAMVEDQKRSLKDADASRSVGSSLGRRKGLDYGRVRIDLRLMTAERVSNMLLLVSIVFVASYIPYWILVLWVSVNGDVFGGSLTPTAVGVVAFFYRSAVFNNAINPILYALLNQEFRQRFKNNMCLSPSNPTRKEQQLRN